MLTRNYVAAMLEILNLSFDAVFIKNKMTVTRFLLFLPISPIFLLKRKIIIRANPPQLFLIHLMFTVYNFLPSTFGLKREKILTPSFDARASFLFGRLPDGLKKKKKQYQIFWSWRGKTAKTKQNKSDPKKLVLVQPNPVKDVCASKHPSCLNAEFKAFPYLIQFYIFPCSSCIFRFLLLKAYQF